MNQILAEYNLDEDAKTYYEKIKEALEKSLAKGKNKDDVEKGGAPVPPEEPEPEPESEPTEEPEPKKPGLFAKRNELEAKVRSLNKYIQECQSESNAILARASVHGLMPDDEQTLKDNNSQLKEMREQLRQVEEELKAIKEETDKDLDKYLDNKKVLDDIEKDIFPADVEKTTIMEVLERNIANREAMLMGDRVFGAEYIAELNAWKKMLDAYRRGAISGIDTKSADGTRDYMDSVREEAKHIIKTKYADTLRKENSDIEEKIKADGVNPEVLLAKREKERADKKEQERKEQERKEQEKKEQEKKEQEKKEQERKEQEKKEQEKKEQERKEQEKKEQEKKEQEKKEQEKKEQEKKEQERKEQEKKEQQRKAETGLLRQSPAYITNGEKLAYNSLTILDKFRAKRKAYEMVNGRRPGFFRSALLMLPSLKYSRLADEFIDSGELTIDDIVYAKYRREIGYYDKAAEKLEQEKPEEAKTEEAKPAERKSEETKPVERKPVETKPAERKPEETKPVKEEPAEEHTEGESRTEQPKKAKRPIVRRVSKALFRDDDGKTGAAVARAMEERSETSEEPKKSGSFSSRLSNGFYRVDAETQAKLRRVSQKAAEARKSGKEGPSKDEEKPIEGEGRVE